MTTLRLRPVLLLVVAALIAAVGFGAASAASAARPASAPATATSNVLPVNPKTHLIKPGYSIGKTNDKKTSCTDSSIARGASRCFAGNFVYDPCWPYRTKHTDFSGMVCLPNAWTHSLVRLPKGSNQVSTGHGRALWGLETAAGAKCSLETGAGSTYHGKPVHFYCTNGDGLAGKINKSKASWTVTEVEYNKKFKPTGSFTAHLTQAWYALGYQGA